MFDRHGPGAPAETSAGAPLNARAAARSRRLTGAGAGWLVAALLALNLVSCGGGGDGGVGTNGTGITAGTVNGFGSVIVDGLRFDDSGATVRTDDGSTAGDSYVPADVKFGQRLRVSYSGVADDTTASKGVAQTLEVDPSIVGVVTEKGANTFKVLGQTVDVIDTVSTQPLPRTVFSDGYSFTSLIVGDTVEVHAVRSGSSTNAIFVATRIEKLTGSPTLRLNGIVSALDARSTGATAKSFFLGTQKVTYATATVLPAGAVLAAGVNVVVFGTLSSTDFVATKVRVRTAAASAVSSDDAYVSGIVADLASGTGMVVGGIAVNLRSLAAGDVSGTLANQAYVRVRGLFGADGTFVASRVQVRDGRADDSAELHGTVVGYTAATDTTVGSFTVRDTHVDVPALAAGLTTFVGCGAANINLAEGAFVEVKGESSATGVTATRVSCETESSGAVVSRSGSIATGTFTDDADRSFSLQTPAGSTYQVTFTNATVFVRSGRALSLADGLALLASGSAIEVEGTLSGTTAIAAKKIKPDSLSSGGTSN